MIDLAAAFEKFSDTEYLKFDRVNNKRSNRPDLHAFLLLNSLCPGTSNIVSDAGIDEIFLGIDVVQLAELISEDQVCELVRCGVRFSEYDWLCMFA